VFRASSVGHESHKPGSSDATTAIMQGTGNLPETQDEDISSPSPRPPDEEEQEESESEESDSGDDRWVESDMDDVPDLAEPLRDAIARYLRMEGFVCKLAPGKGNAWQTQQMLTCKTQEGFVPQIPLYVYVYIYICLNVHMFLHGIVCSESFV